MTDDSSIYIRITLNPRDEDRAMRLAERIGGMIDCVGYTTNIVICSPHVDVLRYTEWTGHREWTVP